MYEIKSSLILQPGPAALTLIASAKQHGLGERDVDGDACTAAERKGDAWGQTIAASCIFLRADEGSRSIADERPGGADTGDGG
jgi:hypothetical protein